MKAYFIRKVLDSFHEGQEAEIYAWIASKRANRDWLFIDVVDSTGRIQVVFGSRTQPGLKARKIPPESSVRVKGKVHVGDSGVPELEGSDIDLIGTASLRISPRPRSHFDIFDKRHASQTLSKRHLYLRNEKLMATLRFRDSFFNIVRDWFRGHGFIEVHGPIITQLSLHDESTAFHFDYFGRTALLTQCVAFYLESAVHALERVYCANPSFRAEKSSGKRYLAEYWHIKGEIAFANLADVVLTVESLISYVLERLRAETGNELATLGVDIETHKVARTPYPRMTYEEALMTLQSMGIRKQYGRSLTESDELHLSKPFQSPFWVTGIPRTVEPFPYRVDRSDKRATMTADLIAPDGYGELVGTAEKIWEIRELQKRMKEKGMQLDDRFGWYCELREYGSVPHSGFGMGVERVIRWLLKLKHVREAIPFPRLFRRRPNP